MGDSQIHNGQEKLIAVVLPTYNGLPYVKEAVNSVLNQTYTDFEFLICDDASTDGTWEYLQSLQDPRIKLFRNPQNKGLFPTLNFLIRQAYAQWIHLWSQDDVMYPFCLEEEVHFARRHPDVPFFFSQRDIIDTRGEIVEKYDNRYNNELISERHLIKVSILAGSVTGNIANTVVRKSAVERAGYFNEQMRYSADFDMWERLSRGKEIGVINKALIQLRQHKGQLSRQHKVKIYQLRENREILIRWISRIDEEKIRKKAIRGINWKIKPMFFAFGLDMLKDKEYSTAKQYFRELHRWENLFTLSLKFIILKILDLFRLRKKFYWILFYKGYYE